MTVEYEEFTRDNHFKEFPKIEERLKVNPKDNTITIKLIKDSWDREEIPYLLVDLCWKYQTEKNYNALDFDTNKNDFVKWIKENL